MFISLYVYILVDSLSDVLPRLFAATFPTTMLLPHSNHQKINLQCIRDSKAYTSALLRRVSWALTSMDSTILYIIANCNLLTTYLLMNNAVYETTGKFPDSMGMFDQERTQSTGLFDECLSVQAQYSTNNSLISSFKGKYCTVSFTLESAQLNEVEDVTDEALNWKVKDSWLVSNQLPWQWFSQKSPIVEETAEMSRKRMKMKVPKLRPVKKFGQFPNYREPSIGYCIPSSCSGEDFGLSVAQLIGKNVLTNVTLEDKLYSNASIVTLASDNYCYTQEDYDVGLPLNFDTADWAIL